MEWFKFYGGAYLSDPKMLMLTACERSCWITLLSYASVAEDGGRVKYLTEQQLMIAASVSPMHEEWDKTVGVLAKFEKLGMIEISNGIVTVKNWQKRQESYLTNAERQKRFRDKQKSNAEVTEPRYESNARIEENRIDTGATRVEIDSEDKRPKAPPKYPHSKEVFGWFSKPEKSWAIDTTQLQHAELLWERGEVEVKKRLKYVANHSDEDFMPKITKPSELERKWNDLSTYAKRNG